MTSILPAINSALKNERIFNSHCRRMAKDNLSLAYNYITSAFARSVANPAASLTLKDRCINLIKAPLLLTRTPLLCLPLVNRVTQLGLRFLSPQNPDDFIKTSPYFYIETKLKSELKIRYNRNTLVTFADMRSTSAAKKLLEENIQKNNEFNPETFTAKNLLDAYFKLSPPLSIGLINSPELKEDEVKVRYSKDTRREFIKDYFQDKIAQKEAFDPSSLNLFDKLDFDSEKCMDIFAKLSPPLSIGLINSPEFKEDEVKARYSKDTRREFIKDYFQDKIAQKEAFDPSSLNLFDKLDFDSEKCMDIFAKLSPDLNTELVKSSTKEDLLARYSKDTRREFVEDCFKEKIAQKEKITRFHLGLSEDEQTIFLSKLGFTHQECTNIFLEFLAQPSEKIRCNVNLKKEVNKYIKNLS